MEELLKQLISKAASSGGEDWLRKCLQDDAAGSQVHPDRSSANSVCAAFPFRSAEPTTRDVIPMRHQEVEVFTPHPVPAKRPRKEKKRFSPSRQSPKRRIKLSAAQQGTRASDKHSKRYQQPLQPTVNFTARSTTVKPVTATATRDSSNGYMAASCSCGMGCGSWDIQGTNKCHCQCGNMDWTTAVCCRIAS
ncbi:uncharacterized protein LOC122922861 isoform X2 [Bufo gargarizans]|uniref:uncharacterized protein LOC122922861 isoform X2 n=1 Tax=Bufo gargarizans TaxID=30331 RepID=UPI001CF3682E|nr:uncharacterized protein LOC122922861 isoform X2 [Bufo gargarizans]